MQNKPITVVVLAALIAVASCGRETPERDEQPSEERVTDAPPASPPAPPIEPQRGDTDSVSVEDIDRWQRGMEAELKATQDAAAKLAEAKDENAKLEALKSRAAELRQQEKTLVAERLKVAMSAR